METQIKEDKVLEFKALTMTRQVLTQLREVKPDEVEGKGTYEAKFIGWVNAGIIDMYIGRAHGTLVKCRGTDVWDWIMQQLGRDAIIAEAEKMGIRHSEVLGKKLDELRNSLPQIFLK